MDALLELFWKLIDLIKTIALWFLNKFLEVSIIEKIIIFNAVFAVVALKMPAAQHYIFETWFPISSPYPEYLIGSLFFMTGAIYIQRMMLGSSSINNAFLQQILYGPYSILILNITLWLYNILIIVFTVWKHLGPGLVKTPYSILPGYYLGIAVPSIYLLLSLVNYLFFIRK